MAVARAPDSYHSGSSATLRTIRSGFWEPWHYGFGRNPRDVPAQYERGSWEPEHGDHGRVFHGLPSFVPERVHDPITRAALRWNVPMDLPPPGSSSRLPGRGTNRLRPRRARARGAH